MYTISRLYHYVNSAHPAIYPEMASKEVWLSEFGYDSDNLAPGTRFGPGQYDIASGGVHIPNLPKAGAPGVLLNKQIVHGQWLARSYIELMGVHASIPPLAGNSLKRLDKFFQYEMRDLSDKPDDAPGRLQFASSGLLGKTGAPKVAHYYTKALLHHLGAYVHEETVFKPPTAGDLYPRRRYAITSVVTKVPSSGTPSPTLADENPMLYRFTLPGAPTDDIKNKYVLWSPTKQGYDYEVELNVAALFPSGTPTVITVHRLSNLSNRGVVKEYQVVNGIARFAVGSSPISCA